MTTNFPRRRRGRGWFRALSYVAFFGVLIAVLFGSFRNQFGELFPTLTGAPSVNKGPAIVRLGPNSAGAPNGPKLPTVVKLGTDSAGPFDSLTTGAIIGMGGPKLPAIVKPGADPAAASDGSRLPAVVKPGDRKSVV